MPITPYHFGPSGFLGLVFRKWIDIPVFILANVVVDVEVLVLWLGGFGAPYHRYCHTLLIGGLVGALWGAAAYSLRPAFKTGMQMLHVPYSPSRLKMVVSGILGVWLHVLLDGTYHPDVKVFWPSQTSAIWKEAVGPVSRGQIKTMCLLFFLAAIVPYVLAVVSYRRQNNRKLNRR